MLSTFAESPTSATAIQQTFSEKFYATRKRIRPRIQEIKRTPDIKRSPQIEKVLHTSIGEVDIEPNQMKDISDMMRQSLGLLDASVPSDPDGLDSYAKFLSSDNKVSLGYDVDDRLVDPITPVSDMYTQFMTIMANEGRGTHILEPVSRVSAALKSLTPLAMGGFMAIITYKGALASAAALDGSFFANVIKSNSFLLSLNVMFVASKTTKSILDNDYGRWQTISAAPLELLRRMIPTATGYLLGGVILGFSGSTIGFIIAKLIVDHYTQKVLSIAIKKILVNKEAFDDMVMEQATSEEMIQKMHAEMLTDPGTTASIYRIPLAFKTLISDSNLRTVAMCAPIIASGLFYKSYGSKWLDWVIDKMIIKSILNPALCKLLARALASNWVKSVSSRACSNMWKLIKKVSGGGDKLEAYATRYMIHHHLCQIVAVLLQNAPLVLLNQKVTMGNMRGGLVSLIESTYMPSAKDLVVEPPPISPSDSHFVADYLAKPSNTYRYVNLRMQELQRQFQKDSIRLGRLRLWSTNENDFSKLSIVDRSYISIACGEGINANGITFADVINFRSRAGAVLANTEWPLLESEPTYIDRIFRAESSLNDKKVLLKAVMQTELEMMEKYSITLDELRSMKTVWPEDIVKHFSKMYQIDHADQLVVTNFHTARLSMEYADLNANQISELVRGQTVNGLSMLQFVTRVYNGGTFDIQSVSFPEFTAWQKQTRDSGEYKKWEGLVFWHNYMSDYDMQRNRIMVAMSTITPIKARDQTVPLPAGTLIDTSHITTSNVGDTLYAASSSPDPILPAATTTAIIGTAQKEAAFTKIGEAVIASTMKQAVSFAANNRLANIKELMHMMYFGGLDAITRVLSGIDGGQEVNAPSEIPPMKDITDELSKKQNMGISGCLAYSGQWHLLNGVVVDEANNKVDEKCLMRPVMGEAIRFASSIMLNFLSFVINWYSGSAFLSKFSGVVSEQIGASAARKALIDMCTARAEKLGCSESNIPIPIIGTSEDRERMVMCHLNNLILNFLCAYTTGGGGILFNVGNSCEKVVIYADVRELGITAQGLVSKSLELTSDMAGIATRVAQIGSTWRSYLSIPGLFGEIITKLGKVLFDAPESMWPLIAGSTNISTARFSYEQVRSEVNRTGDFKTLLYKWYSI